MQSAASFEQRELLRGALKSSVMQSLRFRPMDGYALTKRTTPLSRTLALAQGSFVESGVADLGDGSQEANLPNHSKGWIHLEHEVSLFHRRLKVIPLVLAPVKS
jgi:hypothetical protein